MTEDTKAGFWQSAFLAALPALRIGHHALCEDDVCLAASLADRALDEFCHRFEAAEGPVLTARHMGKATSRFSKEGE
jgi:hypothetical protein